MNDTFPKQFCDYGCGKEGLFLLKNGKFCCSRCYQQCDVNRKKIGLRSKGRVSIRKGITGLFHHTEQTKQFLRNRIISEETKRKLKGRISWNKGLTKETDFRVLKNSKKSKEIINMSFKNGRVPWNKGLKTGPLKEDHKKKLSNILKISLNKPTCKNKTKEFRLNLSKIMIDGGSNLANHAKYGEFSKSTDFLLYKKLVNKYTSISIIKKFSIEELKKRGIKKELGHKHIDHIFSISDGFQNNILPVIIGSKCNIRLIDCNKNISKHKKSDFTIKKLFSLYRKECNNE